MESSVIFRTVGGLRGVISVFDWNEDPGKTNIVGIASSLSFFDPG
jgi:hypothetical protein